MFQNVVYILKNDLFCILFSQKKEEVLVGEGLHWLEEGFKVVEVLGVLEGSLLMGMHEVEDFPSFLMTTASIAPISGFIVDSHSWVEVNEFSLN